MRFYRSVRQLQALETKNAKIIADMNRNMKQVETLFAEQSEQVFELQSELSRKDLAQTVYSIYLLLFKYNFQDFIFSVFFTQSHQSYNDI